MPSEPDSLKSAAGRSLAWSAVRRYLNAASLLATMAVLARLLNPDDFGLAAMISVVTGFLSTVAEAGLARAVVQRQDLTREELASVFWLSVISGVLLALLIGVLSPAGAYLFQESRLELPMAVAGLSFIFLSFGRVPGAMLERELRFKQIAVADTCSVVAAGAVAIVAAVFGAGYWALVYQALAQNFVSSLLRLLLLGWLPRPTLEWKAIQKVTHISGHVTAYTVVGYWNRNLDRVFVGRFLGSVELGFYSRAFTLLSFPINALNGVINPVLHPLLARVQGNPRRMASIYIRFIRVIAYFAIPAMFLLAELSREVIGIVWGPQWGPSVPVFSVLCFAGALLPIGRTYGTVFLATNQARLLSIIALLNLVVLCTGMALGLRAGVQGVAIGYTAAYSCVFVGMSAIVFGRLLETGHATIFRILWRPCIVGALVWMAGWAFGFCVRGRISEVAHLLVTLAIGGVVWVSAVRWLDGALFAESSAVLPPRLRARLAWLIPSSQTGS